MNSKQKNLKVFEFNIENENEFIEYFNDNVEFLESHLIVVDKLTDSIVKLFEKNKICFIENNCLLDLKDVQKTIKENITKTDNLKVIEVKSEIDNSEIKKNVTNYFQPVRAGANIKINNDVNFFERINDGANIFVEGNASFFSKIAGKVEVEGQFVIVKEIVNSGNLLFNQYVISPEKINGITLIQSNSSGITYRTI